MINLSKEVIGDISLLHLVKADIADQPLPTVIYFHGYLNEKEGSLTPAYKMVEKGLRVILPDSKYHGERSGNLSSREQDLMFWEIIFQNIVELDIIKEHYVSKGLTDENRIGVGGTSMGGITTSAALTQYDWIKAATVLMGTPKLTAYAEQLLQMFNESHEEEIERTDVEEALKQLEQYDLSIHPEKLQQRAFMMWHGIEDDFIPIELNDDFFKSIQKHYDDEEKLSYIREADRLHHLSKLSMVNAAEWFSKHL